MPTFRDVNKKYSTRYYLSLVLIDEDARRYFKQSEIVLYRQTPEIAAAPANFNSGATGAGQLQGGIATVPPERPAAPEGRHSPEASS
jgi:vacuolar protein sorting-associated protein 26